MTGKLSLKGVGAVAFAGAALMLAGNVQVLADEGLFGSFDAVADDALSEERGRNIVIDENGNIQIATEGGAVAINAGFQYFEGTINGDAPSGAMNIATGALSDQRFVINAFNTGNNVAMFNQLAISVDMTTP